MGHWSLFLLVKLGLYATGHMDLDALANLAFVAWLIAPRLAGWPQWPGWRRVGWLHRGLSGLLALALAYHDSHWPPLARLLQQWHELSAFSAPQWLELAGRLWSWPLAAALGVGALAYWGLQRQVRMGGVALLALLVALLLPAPGSGDARAPASPGIEVDVRALPLAQVDAALAAHYDDERHRRVRLPLAAQPPPRFDLVFLSVSSLAWDDLDQVGLRGAALLQRLDVLFRRFNSAASDSGPAVLRLLQGSCGHVPQAELYRGAAPACQLFRNLEDAGYEPALLLNHDGRSGHFATQLQGEGGFPRAPEPLGDEPVRMHSFDGTPIHDDYARLSGWWQQRVRQREAGPFALLYNTITLHDGNRVPGLEGRSSLQTYRPRAERLLADLLRFLDLVQASGRPTVVVLVPGHGAAVRGDPWQIAGLRAFPLPRITHVPAGVALLGFGPPRGSSHTPVVVEQVASYTSLVALLASLMHGDEGAAARERLQAVARALPPVEWVAENDDALVLARAGQVFLRSAGSGWRLLPAASTP